MTLVSTPATPVVAVAFIALALLWTVIAFCLGYVFGIHALQTWRVKADAKDFADPHWLYYGKTLEKRLIDIFPSLEDAREMIKVDAKRTGRDERYYHVRCESKIETAAARAYAREGSAGRIQR